jgi:hypothetical protein
VQGIFAALHTQSGQTQKSAISGQQPTYIKTKATGSRLSSFCRQISVTNKALGWLVAIEIAIVPNNDEESLELSKLFSSFSYFLVPLFRSLNFLTRDINLHPVAPNVDDISITWRKESNLKFTVHRHR